MKIQIAQHAGFCSGVEKAYDIALENSKKNVPVYVLGYLVHNAFVIHKLESLGLKSIRSLSEIPAGQKCALIISAHGVGPDIYEEAEKRCVEIVDTTCAWVKKAQKIAHDLAKTGHQIIIAGDKDHTEVKGIAGWAGENRAFIVENPSDLKGIFLSDKVAVVAQTTQSQENFDAIVGELKDRVKELVVHNTICGATFRRQSSAVELAKKSDLMLILGDRRSANTKRLKELCEKTGTLTFQIQDAAELDKKWLNSKTNIGITAGASTPQEIISQVVNKIKA